MGLNRLISEGMYAMDVAAEAKAGAEKVDYDRFQAEKKMFLKNFSDRIDNQDRQNSSNEALLQTITDPQKLIDIKARLKLGRVNSVDLAKSFKQFYPVKKQIEDAGKAGHDVEEYKELEDKPSLSRQPSSIQTQGIIQPIVQPQATQPIQQPISPISPTPTSARQLTRQPTQARIQSIPTQPTPNKYAGLGAAQIRLLQHKETQQIATSARTEEQRRYEQTQQDKLTTAQREADKYITKQNIDYEQKQYDRYLTGLTSKYKYLDAKGVSIEEEIKITETDILEKQKLIEWINMMADKGRTRSISPTDILGTGIQQLMIAIAPKSKKYFTRPKKVETAFGKEYSTDTTAMENDIERAKNKIKELNQLSELYVPGGGKPSEVQELINTGMTAEQRNIAARRKKLYRIPTR